MSDRKLSVHLEHELLLKLEAAGLSELDAQKIIESKNNDLAKKVISYIDRDGYDPSTNQKRAKEIMGTSYLGLEDVMKHFGVSFTDKKLVQLREIPFTEVELEACKKTHILFAGYPLSIQDIRNKAKHWFYDQDWYNNQAFATKEKVNLQWYLIRKDEVHGSPNETWLQQRALLASNEITPRACEVTFMVILYCLVTGKRLLASMYVRCIDLDSGGNRVYVGRFGSDGLYVSYRSDGHYHDYLGLAAARPPATPER